MAILRLSTHRDQYSSPLIVECGTNSHGVIRQRYSASSAGGSEFPKSPVGHFRNW